MNFRTIFVQLTLLSTYVSIVCSFVLMESDSKDLDDRDTEERIVYLVKILQKVKELTEPEFTDETNSILDYNDVGLRTADTEARRPSWPVDKSYERLIDIQKKDFSILPPSSEWCRLMGFRRCRNGASS